MVLTGKIKEHDSHSATSLIQVTMGLLQQVDHGILETNLYAVG